jgi:heat shock protein HtpX
VALVIAIAPTRIAVFVGIAGVLGLSAALRAWRDAARASTLPAPGSPELHATVERLCALADLPKPELVLVRERQPNSWVVAAPARTPRLHVTSGLLDVLEPDELEAVIAHELAHVANRDATVMTVVGGPGAVLQSGGRAALHCGWWGIGGVVAFAIGWVASLGTNMLSRYRELSADAASAALTGRPMALASALTKVSGGIERFPTRDLRAVAARDAFHLLPVDEPPRVLRGLLANHPPLRARIARLEAMERKLHAARPALRHDDA